MFSSRFSLPPEPVDSRLLKNACRLKIDMMAACLNDDDEPGTIYVGYTIEGDIKLTPGETLAEMVAIMDAFRAAQAEKGGCDESNC